MKNKPHFVVVPLEKISAEALSGLVDEFILREGTDYGHHEFSLEEKRNHVRRQLDAGETVVIFDLDEQSASVVRKQQFKGILK